MAAWTSGKCVGRANEVALHRARLVLGWVTVLFRGYIVPVCKYRPTQPLVVSEIKDFFIPTHGTVEIP